MSLKCTDCDLELEFIRGVLSCPDCGMDWAQILLEDKTKYNDVIEKEFNSIIAIEYRMFKDLLNNRQIYGLMFQIKDLYEVIIRIPVLLTASLLFNSKYSNDLDVKEYLLFLMSKPLSLGDWRVSLSKACSILKNKNDFDRDIYRYCEKVKAFVNSEKYGDIVFWRNESLAHGALRPLNDKQMYEDVSNRLELITEFFTSNIELYKKFKFVTSSGKELVGFDVDMQNLGSLQIKINETNYDVEPYFQLKDGGIYFYDRYHVKLNKTNIVEYCNSKKMTITIPEFKDYVEEDGMSNSASVEDGTYTIEERNICEKFLQNEDYYEPKFLTEWLKCNIENGEKLLLLQMEAGMGKSTFIRSIDPFSIGSLTLDGVATRAFYINSTYNSRVDDFAISCVDTLRKISIGSTAANLVLDLDVNAENPKEEFAKFLNFYKKNHYQDKTLLFVFDGIDELSVKSGRNILDFIPDKDMLDDGILVLVTSRTTLLSDKISIYIENFLNNFNAKVYRVTKDMEIYKEFAYSYFKDVVIKKYNQTLKRNKMPLLEFDDEVLKKHFDMIPNCSILNLTLIKEILIANINNAKKEELENFQVKSLWDENLYERYFLGIQNIVGRRYYDKFIATLCVLVLSQRAVTLKELAYLSGHDAPDFAFLGFINSIRLFFATERSMEGTMFKVAHLEQKRAIQKLFAMKNDLYLDEIYEKLISFIDAGCDFSGIEKSLLVMVQSLVDRLYDNKVKLAKLIDSLIDINFKSTWVKCPEICLSEINVVNTIFDEYKKGYIDCDIEKDTKLGYLLTTAGLDSYIIGRFISCPYFFDNAIKLYEQHENNLSEKDLYDFTNTLTYYATYKLRVGENEDALDLYTRSMVITYKLYDIKSKYSPIEHVLSEKVCLSNVYRECGKINEVVEILKEVRDAILTIDENKQTLKLDSFTSLCSGIAYKELKEYKTSLDFYLKAIEKYKICLEKDVKFFMPDMFNAYCGAIETSSLLYDKNEALRVINEMDVFTIEAENTNLLNNSDCRLNMFLSKAIAYKNLKMEQEKLDNILAAKNFFATRLNDEERENEEFIKKLKEIASI